MSNITNKVIRYFILDKPKSHYISVEITDTQVIFTTKEMSYSNPIKRRMPKDHMDEELWNLVKYIKRGILYLYNKPKPFQSMEEANPKVKLK